MGILQTRILEWVAMPFSRGSSWPRDRIHVSNISCIAGRFFTTSAIWEAPSLCFPGPFSLPLFYFSLLLGASQVALVVKNLPAMQEPQEMWVRSLGQEYPLEEGMATHSRILAWRNPQTEKPGWLRSTGLQRIRHDLATEHWAWDSIRPFPRAHVLGLNESRQTSG